MERFLSSYKPPPPKKSKLSEEDQLEKNRKYELKNVREPSIHHGRILLDGSSITSSTGKVKCFARYVGATIMSSCVTVSSYSCRPLSVRVSIYKTKHAKASKQCNTEQMLLFNPVNE